MRLALLLAGQPRWFQECRTHNEPFLYAGRNWDVFLHAWHDPETEGARYKACSGHDAGEIVPDTPRLLRETFQPVRSVIEPQVPFDLTGIHVDGNYTTPHRLGNVSWPYAMLRAAQLMWMYESEKGFRYDRVLLTRYDMQFFTRVPVEEQAPETLWTIDTGLGLSWALCDQVFLGGAVVMDRILNLQGYMYHSLRTRNKFNVERNSFDLCQELGIPLGHLPVNQPDGCWFYGRPR